MRFLRRNASVAAVYDGSWGFWKNDEQADYIVGGWSSGTVFKTVFKSVNGYTFPAQADFAYPFHTSATTVVNDIPYICGSDTVHVTQVGAHQKASYKYESGSWVQIAADCGMGNRCLCSLVYLDDSFYLFGGQDSLIFPVVYFDTVLRSDDGCETFSQIVADTKPLYRSNCAWGGFVNHGNKIWRICGGVSNNANYDRQILSSVDGINWTYRGTFRGVGRFYHQLLSHNGKLWVFNGKNSRLSGNPAEAGGDLIDVWTIEELSGGKLVQTYKGDTGWDYRHAPTIWSSPNGIRCFGGSNGSPDFWTLEQSA